MARAATAAKLAALLQSRFVEINVGFGVEYLVAFDDGDAASAFSEIDADAQAGQKSLDSLFEFRIQHEETFNSVPSLSSSS